MSKILDDQLINYLSQIKDVYGDEIFFENNNTQKNNLESDFSSSISSFEDQINKCHKCDLGNSRTNFVFGVGDENASLMLVGEAPGEKEDLEGEPFVGRAGKLLDKILKTINRSRNKDVFICKVLKCRPPK
jgi:Uracil-DNA glycosylase